MNSVITLNEIPSDFHLPGLLLMLLTCTAIIYICASIYFIYRLRHPRRKGFGAALGHGLPTVPDEACQSHYLSDPSHQALIADECIFETVTFTFSDGLDTSGWIVEGDHPDGHVLIMNHGWGSSRYGLLRLMPFYKPFVSKIVLYDQRGHGDTRRSHYGYTMHEWQDLITLSDEVYSISEKPQIFYGASMGATVSIRSAYELNVRNQSDRVSGLILESPSRYLMQPPATRLKAMRIWPNPILLATRMYFLLTFGSNYKSAQDNASLIKELNVPVMLLHGSEDWLCPLDDARDIVNQATNATLKVFEMTEHLRLAWSNGEDSMNQYFAYLRAFFNQQPTLNFDSLKNNQKQ